MKPYESRRWPGEIEEERILWDSAIGKERSRKIENLVWKGFGIVLLLMLLFGRC